ncbi:hypothetical protein J2T57_003526 [Natronocella acetinitrilica]|uniref:Uncharacterized protein n=1 Tax=Natronocella acetinitrilica TaxID=414046 RepID=A0AAE3G5W8_9GAMM|nr:hypothetical protein [Natronocella acetinitrilica]MCP1676365.1 hypothetical protein [Natronocella acetinitrilica]
MQDQVSATPGVLTVELDFQRSASNAPPPGPLTREQADALGWAIAEDLTRMVGKLESHGLVILGGLYDMTELLRPGLPLVDVLMDLYLRSLPDSRFQPQFMTIGTQGDSFPIPSIAPACEPGSGPLFAVPFLFVGKRADIDELSGKLEKTLLEKGKASMRTGELITEHFGVRPVNLSYATFNDLCALLRIQLEHNGFAELWELLEAALFPSETVRRVSLPEGNLFLLREASCFTRFQPFGQWAAQYSGDASLEEAWGHWHRRQRQFTAGLLAHGIEVRVTSGNEVGGLAEQPVAEAWGLAAMSAAPGDTLNLRDVIIDEGNRATATRISLTEHSLPGLGPVAYTAVFEGPRGETLAMINDYPLLPQAVQEIPDNWRAEARELGVELTMHRPESLCYRTDPPALIPATEVDSAARH